LNDTNRNDLTTILTFLPRDCSSHAASTAAAVVRFSSVSHVRVLCRKE